MRRTMSRLIWIALSATFALHAQFDTGTITGLVKDPSGSAVPGAAIKLQNAAIGLELRTSSNDAGTYEFSNVRVGTYTITAEHTGFSQARAENVTVSVASRTRADLTL